MASQNDRETRRRITMQREFRAGSKGSISNKIRHLAMASLALLLCLPLNACLGDLVRLDPISTPIPIKSVSSWKYVPSAQMNPEKNILSITARADYSGFPESRKFYDLHQTVDIRDGKIYLNLSGDYIIPKWPELGASKAANPDEFISSSECPPGTYQVVASQKKMGVLQTDKGSGTSLDLDSTSTPGSP
jgi:hypothetical protein